MTGRLVIASAAVLAVVVAAAVWLAGGSGPEPAPAPSRAGAIGPSSDTEPYLVPVADGVRIRSLLSVEDGGSASDGYELTGLPDGLGAATGEGSGFTLLMNHEIDAGAGGAASPRPAGRVRVDVHDQPHELGGEGRGGHDRSRGAVLELPHARVPGPGVAGRAQPAQARRRVSGAGRHAGALLFGHAECAAPVHQRRERRRLSGPDLLRQRGAGDEGRVFGVLATARRSSCRGSACSRARTASPPTTARIPRWCRDRGHRARAAARLRRQQAARRQRVRPRGADQRHQPRTRRGRRERVHRRRVPRRVRQGRGRSSSTSPRSTGTSRDRARTQRPKRRG